MLYLLETQITDAGCAALAAALDGGALPALNIIQLPGTPDPSEAWFAVHEIVLSRPASMAVQQRAKWAACMAELRRSTSGLGALSLS